MHNRIKITPDTPDAPRIGGQHHTKRKKEAAMRRATIALLSIALFSLAACSSSPPPSIVAAQLRNAEASANQLSTYGSVGQGQALAVARLIGSWDYKQATELLVGMRPQGCTSTVPSTGSAYATQEAGLLRAHCTNISKLVDDTIELLHGPDGQRHTKAYRQALALADEYSRHAAAMAMLAASAGQAARDHEAK